MSYFRFLSEFPLIKSIIPVALLFLLSCSSILRSSTDVTVSDKSLDSTYKQGIRVLLSEESKEFSIKLSTNIKVILQSKEEIYFEEGEILKVSSSKGIVTIKNAVKKFASSFIKIKTANYLEFLEFNKKSYRGELWLTAQNSKSMVINYLEIEDYLLGVVALEIGLKDEYFYQALKCAAVTARTYALNRISDKRGYFDVTDGIKDQAYGGVDVETTIDSRAVIETKGMILTYQKKPALVFYSANCGGYTEDIANVFGPVNLPYLKGVEDGNPPYCQKSPSFNWSESYSATEIIKYLFDASLIKSKNFILQGMEIPERYISGRAKSLIVYIKDQKPITIAGSKIRDIIKSKKDKSILRSSNFEIEIEEKNGFPSKINLVGKGNGHGVGMCQWGAMNLSRAEKSYEFILQHFFPGTEITKVYDN